MILFAEDWAKYPTANPDMKTTNKTFIRLAAVYREMGIKNYTFILALVNPRLQGVDPFSPDLTLEQKAEIAIECQINPWYYFREVAKAPPIAGVDPVPVEANRGNIALWWTFFNHVMIILIQIRQTGKSFSTDTLMTYLMNIKCLNTQINLMTKDDTLRGENVKRVKAIMSELPHYLQQRTKDDVNNTEQITVRSMGNSYITHVPQASIKRAINMGRGLTSPIFHIDEGPFQVNISHALPAALAATSAAVDRAKAQGTPYGTILTTTAGKKDDRDGKFIYNMLQESAVWTEKFFDAKNLEELEWMIKRNSRTGVCRINATFNHRMLGKSDEWLREKLAAAVVSGDAADRDFFNVWTSGTQSSPLPLNILEIISQSAVGVMHTSISNQGYAVRWYIPEKDIEQRMAEGRFVLGMDTSEASGRDDISMVLMDVETAEVLAAGNYNETNLFAFARWVGDFLVKYSNVTAVIERRSTGGMLLDFLLELLPARGIDPFKRLFNRIVQEYREYPDRYEEICQPMNRRDPRIYDRYKSSFGFATSGSGAYSRSAIYSTTLHEAAKKAGDRMRDKAIVDQTLGLIIKNGRVDHADGEHDDMVIGWLLCYWFLSLGQNLSFYGILPGQQLAALTIKRDENPQDAFERLEQDNLREQMQKIYDRLTTENDEFISHKLEHELRVLDKRRVMREDEIYSLDELIRSAAEKRKNKRRERSHMASVYGQSWGGPSMQPVHGYFSDQPITMSRAY